MGATLGASSSFREAPSRYDLGNIVQPVCLICDRLPPVAPAWLDKMLHAGHLRGPVYATDCRGLWPLFLRMLGSCRLGDLLDAHESLIPCRGEFAE
jgi:hypothetical protein